MQQKRLLPPPSIIALLIRPPWSLLILWFGTLKMAFWFGADYWDHPWRVLMETGIYVGILPVLAKHGKICALFKAACPIQQVFSLGLIVLLFAAQVAKNAKVTYPLLPWDMYASTEPFPSEAYHVWGVKKDGSQFRLAIWELMPMDPKSFSWRLGSLSRQDADALTLPTVLSGIGHAYNRRYGDDSIAAVMLVRETMNEKGEVELEEILCRKRIHHEVNQGW